MTRSTSSTKKFKRLFLFFTLTLSMSLCFGLTSVVLVDSIAKPGALAYQDPTETQNVLAPSIEASPTPRLDPTQPPTATQTPLPGPTSTPTETHTQPPTATPVTEVFGPENYPAGVNPLTGLEVSDPSRLERRPIAVKITNYPRYVRPQSGLSFADIVYEYYLERGITRFIALYYGNDAEKVGPIRSGRFFDEHIFTMYQAIFVFGNADKRVMEHFEELGRSVINRFVLEQPEDTQQSCQPGSYVPLCRDRKIVSYNNMFTNTQALSEFITQRGTDNSRQYLEGMLFSSQTPSNGATGTTIDLDYSRFIYNRWQYDQDNGTYLRFEETGDERSGKKQEYAPLFDALTNQPIRAQNVVVLFVPHEYFVNTPTTEMVKIHLLGEGPAILFRDGFAYPAFWNRPEGQGALYLTSPDGERQAFKPGVTFFEVLGESSSFHLAEDSWQFEFAIP